MKRTVIKGLALCCVLALCLAGCGTQSTVTSRPFDAKDADYYMKLTDSWFHGFEFDFQDAVQGMMLSQEVWQNGVCTDKDVLAYGGTSGLQNYYLCSQKLQDKKTGQELAGNALAIWSVEEVDGGHVEREFAPVERWFPQPATAEYYDAISKKQTLEAGREYTLFLQLEQFDDGIPVITCDELNGGMEVGKSCSDAVKDCEYITVLKLQCFATEAEAEEAAKMY